MVIPAVTVRKTNAALHISQLKIKENLLWGFVKLKAGGD